MMIIEINKSVLVLLNASTATTSNVKIPDELVCGTSHKNELELATQVYAESVNSLTHKLLKVSFD